jgi:hypothetical protein
MGNRSCFTLSCVVLPDGRSDGDLVALKAGLGGNVLGEAAACDSSSRLLGTFTFPLPEAGRPVTIGVLKSILASALRIASLGSYVRVLAFVSCQVGK